MQKLNFKERKKIQKNILPVCLSFGNSIKGKLGTGKKTEKGQKHKL
jgi:hypothetical protein